MASEKYRVLRTKARLVHQARLLLLHTTHFSLLPLKFDFPLRSIQRFQASRLEDGGLGQSVELLRKRNQGETGLERGTNQVERVPGIFPARDHLHVLTISRREENLA